MSRNILKIPAGQLHLGTLEVLIVGDVVELTGADLDVNDTFTNTSQRLMQVFVESGSITAFIRKGTTTTITGTVTSLVLAPGDGVTIVNEGAIAFSTYNLW